MSIDTSKVASTNGAHRRDGVQAVQGRRRGQLGRRAPRPRRRLTKKNLRKVFPDHWSFMLGEIALWSFVVLLLTGVFLTLWFNPSMGEIDVRRAPTTRCAASRCPRPSPRRCTSPSTCAAAC